MYINEYEAECDAANPPKTGKIFKIRCTKDEMVEELPLVHHGLIDCFHSNCFFLTCLVVAGVTNEDLMKCADIAEPMKELHAMMGGSEPFL